MGILKDPSEIILKSNNWSDFLQRLNELGSSPENNKIKGNAFEYLTKYFLLSEPTFAVNIEQIFHHSELPASIIDDLKFMSQCAFGPLIWETRKPNPRWRCLKKKLPRPSDTKSTPKPPGILPKWSQEAFQSSFGPKMGGVAQHCLILDPRLDPPGCPKSIQHRSRGAQKRPERASKSRKIMFRSALLKKLVFNTMVSPFC